MSLLKQIQATTDHAKAIGSLHCLVTDQEIVTDRGIPFVVRILEKIAKKETYQTQQQEKNRNPFLPYEEDLYVCDLSDNHVCLLNKFKVIDNHILVITRDFQSQQDWITPADFSALAKCMQEIDGLAFYNGGPLAGASQPHKHLQLIPFSEDLNAFSVPIETAIATLDFSAGEPIQLPAFPFRQAIAPVPKDYDGKILFEIYESLLAKLGLIQASLIPGEQSTPYNLLATRRWMMVIPRRQDRFERISVNSLGFAGALLVRDRPQLEFLKTFTPTQLLAQVALPH